MRSTAKDRYGSKTAIHTVALGRFLPVTTGSFWPVAVACQRSLLAESD